MDFSSFFSKFLLLWIVGVLHSLINIQHTAPYTIRIIIAFVGMRNSSGLFVKVFCMPFYCVPSYPTILPLKFMLVSHPFSNVTRTKEIMLVFNNDNDRLNILISIHCTHFLYKKEMGLRLSPLMIVIGRFAMDV